MGHLGAKRVTEDLKSAPGASIFNDFSLNFGPNSKIFQAAFFNFQPQVWHGGGLARAAHWIRRPREAGGRACVDLVSNPFRKEAQGGPAARSDANGSYPPDRTSFNFSTPNAYPALPILSNPSNFFQEVPNMLPRSPKRSQLMAKIAQNTPQEPPTRPPKTPKCGQNALVLFVFTLRPFF